MAALAIAAALVACAKKDEPAIQAVQDIKAKAEQRDEALAAVKRLEVRQQKSTEAATTAADGEEAKD